MNTHEQGAFFVIEGTDGSGKSTQFDKLVRRLKDDGYDIEPVKFPQYSSPSSFFINQYLNGVYGSNEDVGPYMASLFFALDRFEASAKIRAALEAGKIVIADRYTGSNMAHQGTKFENREQRRGYFIWLDNLEFEILNIPRPDSSIVLRVPPEYSKKLIEGRDETREYTDKAQDLHEADTEHIARSVEVYDDICNLFPKDFTRIDCVRGGSLMSIDTIHEHLYRHLEPLLPQKASRKAKAAQIPAPTNEYIKKTDTGWHITNQGKIFLEKSITNLESDVYAFKAWLSTLTVAAGMARLSRRADDMRVTILDEFAQSEGKDSSLLQRVISSYGDDSVQQLVGVHVVVENASNLLTKQIEWGRLAAYLEQSTRYIYFDKKNENGEFKYHTPTTLNNTAKKRYKKDMDRIFELYSQLVREATAHVQTHSNTPQEEQDGPWRAATRAQACDAIRPVLPVATTSTVGIYASGQAIEHMIMRLRASESQEARTTGDLILKEARKVIPTFLERADKPERGGATSAYMAQTNRLMKSFTDEHIKESYGHPETDPVRLVNFHPKNELDVVPYTMYEHSSLPIHELTAQVKQWPIERKTSALHSYIGERLNRRHRPGRAFEIPHYTFEVVCDYGIFRDLQRHRMVDNLTWQQLTPRYGYDTPQLVLDADLEDLYQECFDISLRLYSYLQEQGYGYEAQFATLLGHKMRWTITYNARQAFHIHELRTTPQGHPGYRKIVGEMHQKVSEVHPLIGEAMKFVNQDEDPELTRLAAERYAEFRLKKLS